jgi:hypothetical protein
MDHNVRGVGVLLDVAVRAGEVAAADGLPAVLGVRLGLTGGVAVVV